MAVRVCVCVRGDTSIVKLLLDKVKVDPSAPHGREQHAALHVAAKSGATPYSTVVAERHCMLYCCSEAQLCQ